MGIVCCIEWARLHRPVFVVGTEDPVPNDRPYVVHEETNP
jgi:hypothetical protein